MQPNVIKKCFNGFDNVVGMCLRRRTPGLPGGVHIFKPNILILVNFGGPLTGKYKYINWPFT
jgi:hypothetical protein